LRDYSSHSILLFFHSTSLVVGGRIIVMKKLLLLIGLFSAFVFLSFPSVAKKG